MWREVSNNEFNAEELHGVGDRDVSAASAGDVTDSAPTAARL